MVGAANPQRSRPPGASRDLDVEATPRAKSRPRSFVQLEHPADCRARAQRTSSTARGFDGTPRLLGRRHPPCRSRHHTCRADPPCSSRTGRRRQHQCLGKPGTASNPRMLGKRPRTKASAALPCCDPSLAERDGPSNGSASGCDWPPPRAPAAAPPPARPGRARRALPA